MVGDGPERARLRARYPEVHFAGARFGIELARHYVAGDVFVFPSRTDTFGLVLLEAMASGVPVAAFPVAGPLDVIKDPAVGVLDEDLGAAAMAALSLDRDKVRRYAEKYSWEAASLQFLSSLVPSRSMEAPLVQAA